VEGGGGEREHTDTHTHDRNRGRRTRGTPGNTVSHEQRRRRVTFILDFRRAGSKRLSLKASWSSSGVASGKSIWSR
jgi:hypothetical protein